MTPEENVALFEAIAAQAATAAVPAADEMAKAFDADIGRTLRLHAHGEMPAGGPHKRVYGEYYKATPGAPPAFASGDLAGRMVRGPASGGIVASAWVGNTAVYASVQEFGLNTWANSAYMQWHNDRGWWRKKYVHQNSHSYFRTTLGWMLLDGSLTKAAMEGFESAMSLHSRGATRSAPQCTPTGKLHQVRP
jgi:hypothetical protein